MTNHNFQVQRLISGCANLDLKSQKHHLLQIKETSQNPNYSPNITETILYTLEKLVCQNIKLQTQINRLRGDFENYKMVEGVK